MRFLPLLLANLGRKKARTLLTTGTTLTAAVLLASFGGATIRPLALVMSFGIVVGTLSSIFVASPALSWLNRERSAEASAS